jgi:hypothetical protein
MMSISLKGIAMQTKTLLTVLACAVLPVLAHAQPQSDKKNAKVQAKTAHSKPVLKAKAPAPSGQQAKVPVRAAPVLPAALAAMPMGDAHLGNNEMAIAERVHQGHLACELGASVRVEADASRPGYFNLHGKGFRYHMHPVSTSTGAIRLEDKKAGAVWLQLANKSMLMDQNKGRRIADECAHPEQMAFAQDMKNNPPPKLFDTTGMGR